MENTLEKNTNKFLEERFNKIKNENPNTNSWKNLIIEFAIDVAYDNNLRQIVIEELIKQQNSK